MASLKWLRLLCFLLKNGFSRKTFGRTSLEEPELEPKRSPAKQALRASHFGRPFAGASAPAPIGVVPNAYFGKDSAWEPVKSWNHFFCMRREASKMSFAWLLGRFTFSRIGGAVLPNFF